MNRQEKAKEFMKRIEEAALKKDPTLHGRREKLRKAFEKRREVSDATLKLRITI